jgi:hypothetical protein
MRSRPFFFALALLAVAALGFLAANSRSLAEPDGEPHIAFLNITGEGPTAKAWYRGAPPAGVPVQDALDTFSEQGYRVASVSPSQRPIITSISTQSGSIVDQPELEQFFIVLLEKR